ncbi:MAG: hypothetical protein HY744_20720 [Deltaproteobacteria bacterium]|nr:hypothetical protein [Deltaproteobacteria bacterium]
MSGRRRTVGTNRVTLRSLGLGGACLLAVAVAAACTGSDVAQVGTTTGPVGGGSPGCSGSLRECDGKCVAVDLDPSNCGSCGNACPEGQVCSQGQCTIDCLGGTTKCSGKCVDTGIDKQHCGACDNACGSSELCSAGKCAVVCLGGTTECAGGCVDTTVDPEHCGACDKACTGGEVCSAGKCAVACSGGSTQCGVLCVDTQLDPKNCGGCDNACGSGEVCFAGACTLKCLGGTTKCGGKCVETDIDPANCGSCGVACAQGEACSVGQCGLECYGGTTKCGGKCVNTENDPAHCGGCGKACPGGEVCSGEKCALGCGGGTTKCAGKCVNTDNDPAHCGGCDKACPQGKVCAGGQCGLSCLGGATQCGNECVDTKLDPKNCGSCGKACAPGEVCSNAQCGVQCAGGTTFCGGKCVDTALDPANCGGCGKSCAPGEACSAGACALYCGGGTSKCGGKCVDTAIDPGNCGGCGKTCSGGEICSAGKCALQCGGGPCSPGQHLWSKSYYGADTRAYSVAVDSKGNAVVAGIFTGTINFGGGPLSSAGSWDMYLVKFDGGGNHLWSQRFGAGADDYFYQITIDSQDNVIATGYFQGTVNFGGGPLTSAGVHDIAVAKFDKNGTHVWSQRFGGASYDYVYDVETDSADGVVITGHFQSTVNFGGGPLVSAGDYDAFLVKLDKNGTHVWSQRFGDNQRQDGYGVDVDAQDNIALTGYFMGTIDLGGGPLISSSNYNIFLAKYDPKGNHLWSKRYNPTDGRAYNVKFDSGGNLVPSGIFSGTINFGGGPINSSGGWDGFLAKLDKNAGHLWSKKFGDGSDQYVNRLAIDAQDNVVSAGYFQGSINFGGGPLNSAGSNDIYLAKLDKDGAYVWAKYFGDANNNWAEDVAVTSTGRIVACGSFNGTVNFGGSNLVNQGAYSMWVAAFAP